MIITDVMNYSYSPNLGDKVIFVYYVWLKFEYVDTCHILCRLLAWEQVPDYRIYNCLIKIILNGL